MTLTPLMLNTEDELDGNDLHFGLKTFPVGRYGAVGDGVTDDTSAIQAAIDAAVANSGGIIKFLAKTYVISAQLSVTHCNNIRFEGEDKRTILLFTDNATKGIVVNTTSPLPVSSLISSNVEFGDRTINVANGALFSVGDWIYLEDNQTRGGSFISRVSSKLVNAITLEGGCPVNLLVASTATMYSYQTYPLVSGIKVSGITFKTTGTSVANKLTLLQLSRTDSAVIEDCFFSGSVGPLITTQTCFNTRISGNDFEKSNTVAGTGVELQGSTGAIVTFNNFEKCTFGVTFSSSPYGITHGNIIKNRNISTSLGRGIKYQDQSNRGVISKNTVSDMNLFGIYLQDSAYCSVDGNVIADCGSSADEHGIQVGGFEADFCHHNTLSNNIISGCTGYGISINPTSGAGAGLYCVAQGNIITDCDDGGILIFDVQYCVIKGNTCGAEAPSSGLISIRGTNGGYCTVIGNILRNEGGGGGVNGIRTDGGVGFNFIDGNILGSALTNSLDAADIIGAITTDIDDAFPKPGVYTSSQVATGADTNLTTAWTVTIPANTLTATTHGFRMRGIITLADNTNTKNLSVIIGGSTFPGISATAGGFSVEFILEVFYLTSASAFAYCMFIATKVSASSNMPGGTYATVAIDWTASQDIVVKLQNGSASANDIVFRGGKLTFEGIRTAA